MDVMRKYVMSYVEITLICCFIIVTGLLAKGISEGVELVSSGEAKEMVDTYKSIQTYGEEEIKNKMAEIYSKEKDDILNNIQVDEKEIDEVVNNYPSLNEVRLLTLEDENVFYVLKEDTTEYKVGQDVNGSKIKDIRYATEDEVRNIIKSELVVEKANDELYRRAITSLDNEKKK